MNCCCKKGQDMSSRVTFGYWKIRGLGQPIRFLMNYVGQDYEEVLYEQGEGPAFSKADWEDKKFTLGLPFPNLPYLFDGDIKLTQSNAILRHLGAKYNMLGENINVKAYSDMMLENAMDWRNDLVSVVYSDDYKALETPYFERAHNRLKLFEAFLKGKNWFAGGKNPTICDFHMYELLDQHRLMQPGCLDQYSELKMFIDRFEALPPIKKFMSSSKFIKAPVNNKSASWNP